VGRQLIWPRELPAQLDHDAVDIVTLIRRDQHLSGPGAPYAPKELVTDAILKQE
jgi:hypothetical protein